MNRSEEETDELKSMLAVARKRVINFAVCLGQNHETTVFAMHRRKSPDVLGRQVKREGETTKITTGQVRLKAKTLALTCIEPPPPGAARQLRLYFRDFGLPLKIDLLEADGAALESDGDDDGVDAKEMLRPSAPKPGKRAAKWNALLPAFEQAVGRVVAANGPKAGAIQSAWEGAKAAADKGKYKSALAAVKKIKPLLNARPKPENDGADADDGGWARIEARLQQRLQTALAAFPEKADKWSTALDMARQKAADGDLKTAALIARKLSDALEKAGRNGADTAPADTPDLSAWHVAHDALTERLRGIGRAFDTTRLAKLLIAARIDLERSPEELPKALAIAQELDTALTAEGMAYLRSAKAEATSALATIQTYRGVDDHASRLKGRLSTMDKAASRTPPDFEDIHATHAAIMAARADLRPLSDRFEADYNEWMTRKANWCDKPLAKLKDTVVSDRKGKIQGNLVEAERSLDRGDLTRAKRLITDAYWDIKAAEDIVESKTKLVTMKSQAEAAIGQITAALLADYPSECAALKADIDLAAAKEVAGDYYTASLILAPLPAAIAELLARPRRGTFSERLETLQTKVGDDAELQALMDRARSDDPVRAPMALDEAEAHIAAAEIRAAIATGKAPPHDQLKDLARSLEGRRLLDALISEASDEAVPGIAAARFGFDTSPVEPDGSAPPARAADMRKLCRLLADAPGETAVQTRDMLTFKPIDTSRDKDEGHSTSPGPVFHSGISGAVYTSAYNPLDKDLTAFGEAGGTGHLDPDDLGTTTSSGDNPSYGRWAAMHQLGQAINRRKKFMQTNGHKQEFSGWQDHGRDLSDLARTVAAHFGIERAFVERAMTGIKTELPTKASQYDAVEQTAEQLQAGHADFLDWLGMVGHAGRIWTSSSRTATARIGARVIQETSPGHWVSYDHAARAKVVSAVQFRSPGDWFAELYAAYFTNVLHPSHPARDWLSKL